MFVFVLGSLRRPQLAVPTRSAHLEAGRQERWRGGLAGKGVGRDPGGQSVTCDV